MLDRKYGCCNQRPMGYGCNMPVMEGPVVEPTIMKCIEKEIYHEIPHCCPIHTKVINKHIYTHTYTPQYSCSEENIAINHDCGGCSNF